MPVNALNGKELHSKKMIPADLIQRENNAALGALYGQLGPIANEPLPKAILAMAMNLGLDRGGESSEAYKAHIEKTIMRPMNEHAAKARNIVSQYEHPQEWTEKPVMSKAALRKANLDVGSLTNFADVTGGQSLAYVSLDTRMARGTIRPSSFTIYQALEKSLAWQIVDFWALAKATGGAPPGAAFASYPSVATNSLNTSAGVYDLMNITLKLALDGRAITTALAAQNNYVNVSDQETTNAALTVLESLDWAIYEGNSTLFSNQYDGITQQIINNGYYGSNVFDFQQFSTANAARDWSPELTLYNLIYEASAQVTSYANFGHVTHAFMSPTAMGSFQGLTTTQLNNVITAITNDMRGVNPIHINGNLIGMQTRIGHIQFPQDLLIEARNIPVQAIVVDGTNQATTTAPTKPVSVAGSVVTGTDALNNEFTSAYAGSYTYAVASCDSSSLESTLTYSAVVSGVTANSAVQLIITPPGSADAAAFRVFRSGLGYTATPTPDAFRYIGGIQANGSTPVVFTDLNGGYNPALTTQTPTQIPGTSNIYLLDMDPMDLAIDLRFLLPLVRVELFASNLYMPWAIAAIAAARLRVPKFHGLIRNYVPSNPVWSPLSPNS